MHWEEYVQEETKTKTKTMRILFPIRSLRCSQGLGNWLRESSIKGKAKIEETDKEKGLGCG
jgi:hypothetical protein